MIQSVSRVGRARTTTIKLGMDRGGEETRAHWAGRERDLGRARVWGAIRGRSRGDQGTKGGNGRGTEHQHDPELIAGANLGHGHDPWRAQAWSVICLQV